MNAGFIVNWLEMKGLKVEASRIVPDNLEISDLPKNSSNPQNVSKMKHSTKFRNRMKAAKPLLLVWLGLEAGKREEIEELIGLIGENLDGINQEGWSESDFDEYLEDLRRVCAGRGLI